jgi:hypothetical protein
MNANITDKDFFCTKKEMLHLLSEVRKLGYLDGLQDAGKAPKSISRNNANRLFSKSRVQNWINDGLITGKPLGNGKTSTVYYDYARLMELDASEVIKIRKPYIA